MYLINSSLKSDHGGGRKTRSALRSVSATALSIAAMLAVGAGTAYAKGGTAKPPPPTPGGATCQNGQLPCFPMNPPVAPAMGFSNTTALGFDITGFIQGATTASTCAAGAAANEGGTVTVNGLVINVPTDTIVQFPANTKTWHDTVCPPAAPVAPSLALDGSGGAVTPVAGPQPGPKLSSIEIHVVGNIQGAAGTGSGPVLNGSDGVYQAGLIWVSQQSLNAGQGFISSIDYTDGSIYVSSTGGGLVRLLINDPNGRFGRAQSGPDARFSVDDANPTITSEASGYPMCVPRVAPPAPGAAETDPLCPQRNRQRVGQDPTAVTGAGCRNLADAGIAVPRLDLPPPAAGQTICTAFVMKAIAGMPGTGAVDFTAAKLVPGTGFIANLAAGDADPRQQAPFEVGDYISWSGTLSRGETGNTPTTTPDTVWVHTIDANVAIFTQPRTLPAYVHVGEFRIGVDPNNKIAGAALLPGGLETTNRFSAEASVSDVSSVVDFYLHDFVVPADDRIGNAALGSDGRNLATDIVVNTTYNRWLTPESMTGTLANQTAARPNPSVAIATGQPFGGGIVTQFDGPALGRARMRATKVPQVDPLAAVTNCTQGPNSSPTTRTGCAVTGSPTRYVRAVVRQLCAPETTPKVNTPQDPFGVDTVEPSFAGINKRVGVVQLPGAGPGTSGVAPTDGTCGQRAQFANGLFTGQYVAPFVEFITAERIQRGTAVAPANIWQMDFLVHGEGGQGGNSTAPQVPATLVSPYGTDARRVALAVHRTEQSKGPGVTAARALVDARARGLELG